MKIEQQQTGDTVVVRPFGPLAGEDVDGFKAELTSLLQDGCRRVVLDASAIPYADSHGLEALLDMAEMNRETTGPLTLVGCTQTVREVLEIMGISSAFEHREDLETALRSQS